MPETRQEAVRLGRLIAVSQPDDQKRKELATRLAGHSHHILTTEHFSVIEPRSSSRTVILHPFSLATIDANLFTMVEGELGAAGVVTTAEEYDQAVIAVVTSTAQAADGERLAWRVLCLNTLTKLRSYLADTSALRVAGDAHIGQFAAIYQRVGSTLLDVGTSFGFLPILLAERDPTATIVGCDLSSDAITCAADLLDATDASNISLLQQDILAPDFATVGRFDTVTAIHVLEHLREDEVPLAWTNLLSVTGQRLIIAVPFEPEVQPLYGHQQLFNPETLTSWGQWCIETLGGGQFRREEVSGGLLVFDRPVEHG